MMSRFTAGGDRMSNRRKDVGLFKFVRANRLAIDAAINGVMTGTRSNGNVGDSFRGIGDNSDAGGRHRPLF